MVCYVTVLNARMESGMIEIAGKVAYSSAKAAANKVDINLTRSLSESGPDGVSEGMLLNTLNSSCETLLRNPMKRLQQHLKVK